jgi:hypothetical protein
VRRTIVRGELPAIQLGGPGTAVRIDTSELERWLYGGPTGAASRPDPGDTIPLGPARETLHVVEVRPVSGPLDDPVLVIRAEAM